ncbi:hypothetical protein GGTG_04834 [Gaeumannomyces tritici R3-111a-1]|uniref:Threonine/serine exporter-like N-terminal domain-containing protein n=1 Tax=Gaeumannomyces tritici (strain R3-111a-1) TaxID=644352 RepID=J3NU79_GAET3|nr:hypothetical protein GGTG_04834 [Gaeumannomyces tritici R3-111a-1]EJT79750.1 hypothetical protein GGTG_04834 [Gaeumannomyces tritici R3-111a-1]
MSSSANPGGGSRDPSPATGTATPARREKKRVGFHDRDRPPSIVVDDGNIQQPLMTMQSASVAEPDPFGTPRPSPPTEQQQARQQVGAPDASELRRALSQLVTQPDGTTATTVGGLGIASSSATSTGARTPLQPPRPALRRNTSYDVPEIRQAADLAELNLGERQHRSGLAARERAHNLAARVENYTSPYASRRASFDTDEEDLEAGGRAAGPGIGADKGRASGREQESRQAGNGRVRARKGSHLTAENLVRTHTRRAQKYKGAGGRPAVSSGKGSSPNDEYFSYQPPSGVRSGASTPTHEQADGDEYVPRPGRYHGGILGTLLKLYNESGGNSGRSTPGTATPNVMTPNASPPGSAAPSTPASPRPSRPSSGIWSNIHGGPSSPGDHKRQSQSTLGELMKSTSTLMAPGSSMYSESVADKIGKEPVLPSPKKRRSGLFGGSPKPPKPPKPSQADKRIRITKHIAQILSRHKFLVKLCRALMSYGAPTHRLEEYMTMSARVLEIEGQFLYMPGCMLISFDDSSTHTTEVKIVRVRHGVNLGKLRDVHAIYKEVIHDKMGVEEATVRLDEILKRDLKYGIWVRVPIYGLASATVAPFAFQGSFIDMPIAFVLGCLLGIMQLILVPSNEMYANVSEVSAAIVMSFLSRAFGSIRYNGEYIFCFSALAQSSIALILPGYMVLCAALELQSHNIVAGSVRMVYAMIYTLFLGYGITIGTALYGMLDRQGASSKPFCEKPLDRNWNLLFVPIFTLCLCIINQAKWRQTPVMLTIAFAGYCVNSYSATFFVNASQVSNMLGALTVGILANLYSRLGRHVRNAWLDFLDWWEARVRPRFSSVSRRRNELRGRTATRPNADEYTVQERAASAHTSDAGSRPPSPGAEGREKGGDDGDNDNHDNHDKEARDGKSEAAAPTARARSIGYGLAAAAMLPAIFVQVPGGLAAGGSLLAGIQTANQITRSNMTVLINGTEVNITSLAGAGAAATSSLGHNMNSNAFSVLFNVIQVAIGLTVGLFLSALIVYPFGKRRSGLLSF